jgi:murein DD-endopeptidase MepM/ murein hydrolase activator NlpD
VNRKISPQRGREERKSSALLIWFSYLMWGVAVLMLALTAFLVSRRTPTVNSAPVAPEIEAAQAQADDFLTGMASTAALPVYQPPTSIQAISRSANVDTVMPEKARDGIVEYTVQAGDSIFGIAQKFDLKPDTILWANFDSLNDDPHMISIGLNLKVPPTDGILYQWKDGDQIESVANQFRTSAVNILNWSGNWLDLTNPSFESGTMVMVPGGWREFRQWVVPTVWRPRSGTTRTIPGGCQIPEGGAFGTGTFVWPAANRFLSGNDYWDGHLAIDIAAATGAPVYASDSGVVVYAAAIGGGYGNMIMIDHGNGYHTVYAHLSQFAVRCGQSVYQGNTIGFAGSTGNSTGPHLHFEVRYLGGFINPWNVLP